MRNISVETTHCDHAVAAMQRVTISVTAITEISLIGPA
jgi:hypothetical protein